jgi:hypothetical protein
MPLAQTISLGLIILSMLLFPFLSVCGPVSPHTLRIFRPPSSHVFSPLLALLILPVVGARALKIGLSPLPITLGLREPNDAQFLFRPERLAAEAVLTHLQVFRDPRRLPLAPALKASLTKFHVLAASRHWPSLFSDETKVLLSD